MSGITQNIIGLSGHIDHGKTSLVKALTGKNTDNLKEEIKRGMTINIGFAFLSNQITLIDVPGHERFIKNMVAGVNAIDYALLVIAADDGIMPQTLEHFEILKLFNIKDGYVVINKIDTVDIEWIDLIESEIIELVEGSFLENKHIHRVSAITMEGIEKLKNELNNYNYKKYKNDCGISRIFIDRVFTSKGFGSVITGTIISGKIKLGDKLKILPQNKEVKVRGLQTHNEKTNLLEVGSRAAINIQSNEKINIERGNHISHKDYFMVHEYAVVSITVLSKLMSGIKNNERLRIYCGTQEVMARILIFDGKKIDPGNRSGALLKFEKPIILSINDNYIARKYSPLITVGGGKILDFNVFNKWKENKRYIKQIYNAKDKSEQYEIIIASRALNPFNYKSLSQYLNITINKLQEILETINELIFLENEWILTKKQIDDNTQKIIDYFKQFHKNNPYRKGVIKEEILNYIKIIDFNFLDVFLQYLLKNNQLKKTGDIWSLISFEISLSENDSKFTSSLLKQLEDCNLNTLTIKEIIDSLKQSEKTVKRLLSIEVENNNIVIIDSNLVFSKKSIENMIKLVKNYFKKNSTIDIKAFKILTNTSRKYAVPLLEYLDKIGLTYRQKNERKLNH